MLNKIKSRWEAYKKKESVWGHISNAIFIVFVIAMLIPASRKYVSSKLIKLTLFDYGKITAIDPPVKLSNTDKGFNVFNSNEAHSLHSFDGQVIVINFWATWCPPCIAEMPNFQNLYNQYQNKVVFLFLTGDNQKAYSAFLKKNDYSFPVFNYSNIPPPLNHSSIPTSFIINRNSEIVFEKTGAYKWDSDSMKDFLDRLIEE